MQNTAVTLVLFAVWFCSACGPAPIAPRPDDRKPAVARKSPPDGGPDRALPADGGAGAVADADAAVVVDAAAVDAAPAAAVDAAGDGADADAAAAVDAAPADAAADAGGPRMKLPAPNAGADAATDSGEAGPAAARAPRAGDIAVVEALVNPAGQDVGREWIEVLSLSAEPVDLSALHIADAAVDVAAPAGVLAPGGRVVLGQSADPAANGGAPVAVAYGTRLALNNDGEQLALCLGPCADGAVLDRVTWGDLGAAYDGHALVLDRSAAATCSAEQPFGSAGDFGTPGEAGQPCPRPDGAF
jgi:hypothetical protein